MTEVKFQLKQNFNREQYVYSPQDLTKLTGSFRFLIIKEIMKSTAKNYKARGQPKSEFVKKISDFTINHVLEIADEIFGE